MVGCRDVACTKRNCKREMRPRVLPADPARYTNVVLDFASRLLHRSALRAHVNSFYIYNYTIACPRARARPCALREKLGK